MFIYLANISKFIRRFVSRKACKFTPTLTLINAAFLSHTFYFRVSSDSQNMQYKPVVLFHE